MNRQMQEQKKKELREEAEAKGYGYFGGNRVQPPEDYRLRSEELSCISMIDSILCYGGFGFTAEQVMKHEEMSPYNYLAKYVELFGRDRVVELIQGQIDSIESINHGVFTDGEGCTYNSINYKN